MYAKNVIVEKMCVCMYACMFVCVCVYIYIYIYTHTHIHNSICIKYKNYIVYNIKIHTNLS